MVSISSIVPKTQDGSLLAKQLVSAKNQRKVLSLESRTVAKKKQKSGSFGLPSNSAGIKKFNQVLDSNLRPSACQTSKI